MSQSKHLPSLEARRESHWTRYLVDSILAILGTLLLTGLIYIFHLYPSIPNISLVYLLVVLALASTRGLFAAVLSALVAFSSFDFFLVPPLFTFTIAKTEEWLALFIFLTTAIITGQLASALRKRAEQADRRERETRILYELIRAANSEEDLERQLRVVAYAVVDVFAPWGVRDCIILLPDAQGKLTMQAGTLREGQQLQLSADEEATISWVMKQAQTVELHDVSLAPQQYTGYAPRAVVRDTATLQTVRRYVRMIPLKIGQRVVGVVRLVIEDNPRYFTQENRLGVDPEHSNSATAFFWTFLNQATSIIERARLRNESLQIELLRRTDELRAALLSSVSHDLRTPLSSIKAAASSLLQQDVKWDEESQRSFALAIEKEADRLNRLVGNLLDMSRIEGGALKPEKEWYPVDELIHDVLGHMQPLLQGRPVMTNLPDDLPPVELDYLQMDQVLTNLIENAVRYTPPGSPIELSARLDGEQMVISVADRGPGIPVAEDRERIFDKFYRVLGTQNKSARTTGSGLGLAVCKGLVEAHGGHIWVENRAGGGAIFSFTLPVGKAEDSDT
ncbi:MAG TPA: ATP-binding protein [Ktedonobacteraceae bacterium]|nr:ATP-binding protein [Ktedonobacteraceae bacterium]